MTFCCIDKCRSCLGKNTECILNSYSGVAVCFATKSLCLREQVFQGLLERDTALVMNITGQQGDTVDIVVENMGRVNFGSKINDYKARQLSPFSFFLAVLKTSLWCRHM